MQCVQLLVIVIIILLNCYQCTTGKIGLTKCKIRCGVLDLVRRTTTLPRFVNLVWKDLKRDKSFYKIDMEFVEIKQRNDMTMDELIDAYMEIGTSNISALIGPYMHLIATATEKFGLPYFVTTDSERGYYNPYNLIRVFPNPSTLLPIAVEVVRKYHWKDVAVFYETDDDARLIEELTLYPDMHIRSWKIKATSRDDQLTKALLQARQLRVTNILLLTSGHLLRRVLNQALGLSMLSSRYSWMLPSLKLDKTDILSVAYTAVNLTTLHLVQKELSTRYGDAAYFSDFEYATLYDSLMTLYLGVVLHERVTGNCLWTGRTHLLPVLSKIADRGATGELRYRQDGTRKGFLINILSLQENGLKNIGHWNSSVTEVKNRLKLNMEGRRSDVVKSLEYPLGKDIVKVVTIIEPPFMMLKEDHEKREGNDRFEGYCYDLLEAIAKMLGFQYQLYLVPDNSFGDKHADGTWDGLVNELVNGNASMAMASLTISSQREKVIDFSKPFKAFSISMVMRRPHWKHHLFEFTEPLSASVWILLSGALIFVSVTLYMIDKATPARSSTVRFDCSESVWFTFASMVLSGTDMIPRTIPSRILAGSLWFFSLIIISSYTANLAAFLTVSNFETPIQSIRDLAGQTKVRYGTVKNSEVSAFFQHSKLQHFQTMWDFMTTVNPGSLVGTTEEGFIAVKQNKHDYAFLWDSPVIKYRVNNDCSLVNIGHSLESRGYGIGVPLGASYRDDLTMAILQLSESGVIPQMEFKWWGKSRCPDLQATTQDTQSLTMDKVVGIFVILAIGIVLSLTACAIQYLLIKSARGPAPGQNRSPTNF